MLSPSSLVLRGIPLAGTAWFALDEPLHFHSDIAKGLITVPDSYLTDLASIPKPIQGEFMLHDDPAIGMGAIVHDYLYENKGRIMVDVNGRMFPMLLSREQCDQILCHEAMVDLGATPVQVAGVYDALRVLGDSWGDNYPLTERFKL